MPPQGVRGKVGVLPPIPPPPPPWLSNWKYRVKITIDHTKISAGLTDFPILVHLSTASGINDDDISFIFDELASDANRKKIAVTKDDAVTQCYVEIEKWDDANEKASLWVKVPAVSQTEDTILYLYFDSTKADNTTYVGDTDSTPAENVWDSFFKAVYHMAGSGTTIKDSTSNNNDLTKKAASEPAEITTGKIGNAQDYDGVNDWAEKADNASLRISGSFTLEVLINMDKTPINQIDWARVVGKERSNVPNGENYYLQFPNTNAMYVGYKNTSLVYQELYSSGFTFNTGVWYYLAGILDASIPRLHFRINEAENVQANKAGTPVYNVASPLIVGGENTGSFTSDAKIDEVRVSATRRSDAWCKASYYSNFDDLVDFGTQESY